MLLELIVSTNLTSIGRSFQIFGALDRIVWVHDCHACLLGVELAIHILVRDGV